MYFLAAVFGVSVALALGFLALRSAEIRAGRRFALARLRRSADALLERRARATSARLYALERRALGHLRAMPHRAGDVAAAVLRVVATRALRMLRWLHERRAHGRAPSVGSRGSVSFFVSALGETPHVTPRAAFGTRAETR